MAKPPIILISPSIEKRGVEFLDLSISLSLKYQQSILNAGGLPFICPITDDRSILAEAVAAVDGVLLTGGDDINPDLYDENLTKAILKTISQSPDQGARDWVELVLIDEIFTQRKPLLAICRGHQLINVALGGGLIADIKQQVPKAMNHQRLDKASEMVHEVSLTRGSMLSKIVGKRKLAVNSSHHQAVMKAAEPLMATALSEDGLVEAMELKPEATHLLPYFLSVQFHPERLAAKHVQHRAIFQSFIKACVRQNRGKL
jgi:putative glutamine amidotransferase